MIQSCSALFPGCPPLAARLVLLAWALPLLFLAGPAGAASLRGAVLPESRAVVLELGPLPPLDRDGQGGPRQVGAGRELEKLQTPEGLRRHLVWQQLPKGGHVATVRIVSAGAAGLRLGLLVHQVPDGAEFRFFGRGGKPLRLVAGKAINRVIARNLAAGDAEQEARLYWSSLFAGDCIGLEIYLPPPLVPEELDLAIPLLSHLFAR